MLVRTSRLKPGVRARWFRDWNPELDAALDALPETECCPRELYRLLCADRDPRKTFALLTDEAGVPAGVVGLRRRAATRDWVPVTHHIVPGIVFPVRAGSLAAALSAIDRNVWLVWWRMGEFREHARNVRRVEVSPTRAIDFAEDGTDYWRRSKNVKGARKRCEGLELRLNAATMSSWVITSWEQRWRTDPGERKPDLEDRILAAAYLERRGRYFTFTLHDGERPVAGSTVILHEGVAVGHYNWRDPAYDRRGVGIHLLAITAQWAVDAGCRGLDLGMDHGAYKSSWGPVRGTCTSVHICPPFLHALGTAHELASRARRRGIVASLRLAADVVRRRSHHEAGGCPPP